MVEDRLTLYLEWFFFSVPCLNALQWEATRTTQPYLNSMWEEDKNSTLGFERVRFDAVNLYWSILSLSRYVYLVS